VTLNAKDGVLMGHKIRMQEAERLADPPQIKKAQKSKKANSKLKPKPE